MTKSETAKELLLSNSCKNCQWYESARRLCHGPKSGSIYKIDREKIETYCKYWESK